MSASDLLDGRAQSPDSGRANDCTPDADGVEGAVPAVLDLSLTASEPLSASLAVRIERIEQLLQNRLQYDGTKEALLKRLANEVDQLREESTARAKRPLLLDLVLLYDSIDRLYNKLGLTESIDDNDAASDVAVIRDELLEVLARQDVYPYEDRVSDVLDPRKQRAVAAEFVSSTEKSSRVLRTIRRGFTHESRVLRPEEVVIGKARDIEVAG
jgi:molecular chaperone GrpE (heat shock protein)